VKCVMLSWKKYLVYIINIILKPSKMRRKWSEIKSILFYCYSEEKSNRFNRSFVTITSKMYLKPSKMWRKWSEVKRVDCFLHSKEKPSTLAFFQAQMVTKLRQVRNGLIFQFQERYVLKPAFSIWEHFWVKLRMCSTWFK